MKSAKRGGTREEEGKRRNGVNFIKLFEVLYVSRATNLTNKAMNYTKICPKINDLITRQRSSSLTAKSLQERSKTVKRDPAMTRGLIHGSITHHQQSSR